MANDLTLQVITGILARATGPAAESVEIHPQVAWYTNQLRLPVLGSRSVGLEWVAQHNSRFLAALQEHIASLVRSEQGLPKSGSFEIGFSGLLGKDCSAVVDLDAEIIHLRAKAPERPAHAPPFVELSRLTYGNSPMETAAAFNALASDPDDLRLQGQPLDRHARDAFLGLNQPQSFEPNRPKMSFSVIGGDAHSLVADPGSGCFVLSSHHPGLRDEFARAREAG